MQTTPPTVAEYFNLFRALPDKYLLLSPEGVVLDLNDAHASSSLPERQREEVVGLDFFTVWPPNSDTEGEVVRRSHEHVRQFHAPDTMPLIRYDLPIPTENGGGYEQRYWQATHFPVLDPTGQLRFILQKTEDVTEQQLAAQRHAQVQQQLDEQQQRTRFILESLPVMVWTATPAGVFDGSNQRLQQFTGWAAEELMGPAWLELIHPEDRPGFDQVWQQAVATAADFQAEYRLRRHDGQHRWQLVRGTPRLTATGDVLMWIGSNTDIQEQKQMVQELLEANEQQALLSDQAYAASRAAASQRDMLYSLLETAPAMFAILRGPEHRYEYVNPGYKALFAGRELLGRTVAELVPEASEQGFSALLDQVYQTGTPFAAAEASFSLIGADGKLQQVYLNFSYQPFREDGRIVGLLAFAYDVTDLVKTRQTLEQLGSQPRG
ncbi:PAS domain-containing protein [Hymenobacter endophyticus]|uniref:histidine kinase n=1 Tax=Hymenobacter endophyticus TaxID=3076335 RepID=A0ABU3TJS0_9BACT|nr:PAS domain-containing protein [Hymenobacter endophyticus]MDU0371620.1 PAS domain-containing protein [Hymenobacter endophyticus]